MWAIGGGLESADTAPSSDTQTQSHVEETHIYSLCTVYVKIWSTQTGTHQRSEVRQWRKHPQQRTFYWGRCIIQLPGQRGREGVWFMVLNLVQITLWDESMNGVTWLRCDNGVWKCSRCSAHLFMFSSLNNKQKLQFCILTPGTIPLPIPFKIYNIYH